MPIRPENLARYPANWPEVSQRIRERAGNCCEVCGVPNGQLGGRGPRGTWWVAFPEITDEGLRCPEPGTHALCRYIDIGGDEHRATLRIIRIVLTVAHLDHTPEHCDDENLKAMCQRCHLLYDQKHHAQTAWRTRRAGRALADLFGESRAS